MRILILCASLVGGGCATFGGSGVTQIVSEPPGALVRVEGASECQTPCTVKFESPREVTIAKVGYKAQRLRIGPDQSKVKVTLELAVETEEIETNTLPEVR